MNKKLKEGKSKLQKFTDEGVRQQESLGLVSTNKKKVPSKSFRLTDSDIVTLKSIQAEVNGLSNSHISETKIIQALIHIGKQTNKEKILKAIKEVFY